MGAHQQGLAYSWEQSLQAWTQCRYHSAIFENSLEAMSLPRTWKLYLHAILSFSTIAFPVPDYSDERALVRKMEHHNPSACIWLENRRCWLMLCFPFSPESLYTNARFCNVVQCGYSKAVWGLATKACPHHRQKRCSLRMKFPSGVLQIGEHLDWITASITERNNWDVINCN